MRDELFDTTKLGIEDGLSLIVPEGATESTSDGISLGFFVIVSEGAVESASEGIVLEEAEGYFEGRLLGSVLIDGDNECFDVGYPVAEGASLGIRLG